ncbi:MAG: peptide chain release factor 1 [Patescibacteria group bacterium]|nr:peptide chain release factor 1 [Patescibacteria group bacterium]
MLDIAIRSLKAQVEELKSKAEETKKMLETPDFKEMAESELLAINTQIQELESTIYEMETGTPSNKDKAGAAKGLTGDCIVEIRAGTGGDEAGLFAGSLFVMYSRFAEMRKWKVHLISKNEGGIGNIKEIVFEIKGRSMPSPYEMLEYESGTHRVQRVPVTESGGRIHTSTATVAVLPIVEEKELTIRTEDLQVDTFRAGGAGGQHVNKTESAIRITHLPTGVVVQCQDERSQHKNKERAMSTLRSKLFEIMQRQQKSDLAEIRADQVGTGDRSEKIRTYNFPQDRITDHRIKKSWFGINKTLMGEILDMVNDTRIAMKENPDLVNAVGDDD